MMNSERKKNIVVGVIGVLIGVSSLVYLFTPRLACQIGNFSIYQVVKTAGYLVSFAFSCLFVSELIRLFDASKTIKTQYKKGRLTQKNLKQYLITNKTLVLSVTIILMVISSSWITAVCSI